MLRERFHTGCLLLAAVCVSSNWSRGAEPLTCQQVAGRVDEALASELFGDSTPSNTASRIDDTTFLRRVMFDITGVQPTPEQLTAFLLDASPTKRAEVVGQLLADPRYGENWGHYWRDVILYRRLDERALLSSKALLEYLTTAFNENRPWSEIAQEFLTARGLIADDGRTGLIASQWGEIPETAAEASRIFLGIQIQCAQCHDHPTDRWTREQFHEYAAFFPRIVVRRFEKGQGRSFQVASVDQDRKKLPKAAAARAQKRFEHFMPDLADPAAPGTLMQPVFFLTGESLKEGESDADRREILAKWMTSDDNEWFAKAFINRVWAELVGEGFYEPVDDLGPDRSCHGEPALQLLSDQFVAHNYDTKWLLETILATDAYQRESRPRRNADELPFAASCPQRLRGDQLYDALAAVLELPESKEEGRPQRYGQARTPRAMFNQFFGYDPSEPRDEIAGSIPQALLMMNNSIIDKALQATTSSGNPTDNFLGQLLASTENDTQVIVELYLRSLAREPNEQELNTCLDYVRRSPSRGEAMEDLLWALINSTEFLYRE